jgi:hypothetical protein
MAGKQAASATMASVFYARAMTMAGSVPSFDTRAGGNYVAACRHYIFSNIIPPIECGGFPTAAVLNDYYAVTLQ